MNENTQALEIVTEKPQELMRRATDVAGICKEIVLKTAVQIQGRKYVKCEGWMSIATAHGCIASSRDVEKVEGGWKAIGEIKRIHDGVVLSTAEGFVGMDETKTWAVRPEYACRAMAQTRAISRACRAAFAHVVVLMDAGLSTTPAEEVPEGGFEAIKAAKPVQTTISTPPTNQNAANQVLERSTATPEPPKTATAVTRSAMMEWLLAQGATEQDIVGYAIDKAILMPNEGLADWPLDKVGTSKQAWSDLAKAIRAWMDGDLAAPAAAPAPAENRIVGLVQAVSEKSGTSKKNGKPWTKYGIKIADGYLDTFDAKIAEMCQEAKNDGKQVDIEYRDKPWGEGKSSREIVSCVVVRDEVTP
jgi:hypothetical protein